MMMIMVVMMIQCGYFQNGLYYYDRRCRIRMEEKKLFLLLLLLALLLVDTDDLLCGRGRCRIRREDGNVDATENDVGNNTFSTHGLGDRYR